MDNNSTIQQFNSSASPDVVIRVEGLWKQYRYGTISHETLRRDFESWWARVRGKEDPNIPIDSNPSTVQPLNNSTSASDSTGEAPDRFWALRDVSFEVKQGEVLGIIGKNGAGKSTLLKIMSKVTTPTKGEIKIKGRVASLLEVGTGFHPELTGRENIYLNGAILGMTKDEIKRKFDEIVAFAEVEKFVDTPVKRYSSGMYVRLAFAVAAHLEPEILIVDEVLAVGDAQFQKKCLGKMGDVAKEGRTVLIVSHQMPMIRNLCSKCLYLNDGRIDYAGVPEKVIPYYLQTIVVTSTECVVIDDKLRNKGMPYFALERFALTDSQNIPLPATIYARSESYVVVEGMIHKPNNLLCIGFSLVDSQGYNLFLSFQTDQPFESWPRLGEGKFRIRTKLDLGILCEGRYRVDFFSGLHCDRMLYTTKIAIGFELHGNMSQSPYWVGPRNTVLAPALRWVSF